MLVQDYKGLQKMPNIVLKYKAAVSLLDLYINTVVMQRVVTV